VIGFKLSDTKRLFFDRPKVMAATDKAERAALSKMGAFVRRRAQTSIRPRKEPSRPGEPPHGHGEQLLRRNIYFVYEPRRRSVVIGPIRLNKVGTAPEALEHGGLSRVGGRQPRIVRIDARPYMGPAMIAEQAKAAPLWRNAVR